MCESDARFLIVGRIVGAHGIKGWVKIHSYTEPADNLLGYRDWKIRRRDRWEPIEIDNGQQHGKGLVAHIRGVDHRDVAELLKGCDIAIPRSQLPALETNEYYWHQLEGLAVYAGDTLLGRVDHLMETGANDVLVVRACEGSLDGRERLIPWAWKQTIRAVDLDAGRIEVDWDPEF